MKPLTNLELISLQKPVQHFCDCYLVSSIAALARSSNGRKILTKNIAHDGDGFRIRFQNLHSKPEDYFISKENIEELPLDMYQKIVIKKFQHPDEKRLDMFDKADHKTRTVLFEEYEKELIEKFKPNIIINAIEVAMDRIIKKHPSKKPIISRLFTFPGDERFEYNYPSNFLEMFTGEKPIILNERSLRMNLKKDKEKAFELFEKIDKADDFSMVAGTGLIGKNGLTPIHCYTIEGVNSENRYLQIFNCRELESLKLTFDQAIKAIKFLTGYIK